MPPINQLRIPELQHLHTFGHCPEVGFNSYTTRMSCHAKQGPAMAVLSVCAWNPKQLLNNGCLVKQPFPM